MQIQPDKGKCGLRRRRRAGFATVTVLFIVALAVIAAMVLLTSSLFQVRSSTRGQNKMNALLVAEAGVDDAVGNLQAGLGYTGTGTAGTPLYEDPVAKTKVFGTFVTTVTTPSGDSSKRLITSIGRTSNGTTANGGVTTVYALVGVESKPLGSFAAVAANGNATVGGTADVITAQGTATGTYVKAVAPNRTSVADVFSNSSVTASGSSTIDGQLQAVGTVSGTIRATMGGVSGVPAFPFPSATTTESWRQDWISKAGTSRNPPKMNGNKQNVTVTAPAYINGDLRLNSDDFLELRPGTDPSKNVIYVNGSVVLGAQSRLINGVTLVVSGTFEQQGGAQYYINRDVQYMTPVNGVKYPTPSLNVYGLNNGVPVSGGTTTIKLVGGSQNTSMGIVYAVNGDIDAAGNATYVGALVAGGTGGQVKLGGGFQLYYPNDMAGERNFDWGAKVIGITEP
jgi:hypothetical protein